MHQIKKAIAVRITFIALLMCLRCFLFGQHNSLVAQLKNADTVFLISHDMVSSSTNEMVDEAGNKINLNDLVSQGKLTQQLVKEKKILSKKQIHTVIKILTYRYKPTRTVSSSCFDPHHAIIIIKDNKISLIDLCFHCRGFETSNDIKNLQIKNDKWDALYILFKKLGFKYEMNME